jgi:hypothetical protein
MCRCEKKYTNSIKYALTFRIMLILTIAVGLLLTIIFYFAIKIVTGFINGTE